MSLGAFLMWFS